MSETGNACAKKRYFSRRSAKRFASQQLHVSVTFSPYKCRECGSWHLTSQSAKRKAFLRRADRKG